MDKVLDELVTTRFVPDVEMHPVARPLNAKEVIKKWQETFEKVCSHHHISKNIGEFGYPEYTALHRTKVV